MRSKADFHVLIPTHSAHDTLSFAVESAVNQTLKPSRITIIGDGVTETVRATSIELTRKHKLVEFIDRAKHGNRGEKYRDEIIRQSDADFIAYLCDDDLLMPTHLETMATYLQTCDFVHPRPTFFSPNGKISFIQSGIENPKVRAWHSLNPPWNSISLTGTVHTRQSYLMLKQGWDAGPKHLWTDLYMWVKFLAVPEIRACTVPQTSTIKLLYSKHQRRNHLRTDLIESWSKVLSNEVALDNLIREIERLHKTFERWRRLRVVWIDIKRTVRSLSPFK